MTQAQLFQAAFADAIANYHKMDPKVLFRLVDQFDSNAFFWMDPGKPKTLVVDFTDGSRAELEWGYQQ